MARMAFSKSLLATPTMMFISLEPWSIILMFTSAFARAVKSRADVPFLMAMPAPTVAISAMSVTTSSASGFSCRSNSSRISSVLPSMILLLSTTDTVSMPLKGMSASSISLLAWQSGPFTASSLGRASTMVVLTPFFARIFLV